MSSFEYDKLLQQLAQKDFLTYQYSVAVSEKMGRFAKKLALDEAQCREATILGAVHDLGKVLLPAEIFRKLQGGAHLSPQEKSTLHQSPETLYKVVEKKLLPENVQKAVAHIYCRYDGKGEPALAGKKIHLFARMLHILMYHDSLCRQRVGRRALKDADARKILTVNRGILFDPELVDIFQKGI